LKSVNIEVSTNFLNSIMAIVLSDCNTIKDSCTSMVNSIFAEIYLQPHIYWGVEQI